VCAHEGAVGAIEKGELGVRERPFAWRQFQLAIPKHAWPREWFLGGTDMFN
jgi:hypothetical protein